MKRLFAQHTKASPSSANQALAHLGGFFSWAIQEDIITGANPAHDIKRNKTSSRDRVLDDKDKLRDYRRLRKKYFLPVRPLDHYVGALRKCGFTVEEVSNETIEARVSEWYEFLSAYHEGVLGWAGGVEKIEGRSPTEEDVRDRLALMKSAMELLFEGKDSFNCCWTYITCRK